MKIGNIELEVGAVYVIDGQDCVLMEVAEAIDGHHAYAVFDIGDCCWELWYGSTEYYKKEGWHGVDGEGTEDEDGARRVRAGKETDDEQVQ